MLSLAPWDSWEAGSIDRGSLRSFSLRVPSEYHNQTKLQTDRQTMPTGIDYIVRSTWVALIALISGNAGHTCSLAS